MANLSNEESKQSAQGRLSARFLLFFLALALLLGGAAFWFNDRYVSTPLDASRQDLVNARQQRIQDWLHTQQQQTQFISHIFNAIAASHWGKGGEFSALSQTLLNILPVDSPIVAFGLWPEPGAFQPGMIRSSYYWTLDSAPGEPAKPSLRTDYNLPERISYAGELWYAPLRYYEGPGCIYTRQYDEVFLKRPVLSCASPVRINDQFMGVTTLVIDPQRWQIPAEQTTESGEFFLLLDFQQELLHARGLALNGPMNLAALAQQDARFGPIAVALHQLSEGWLARMRDTQSDTATLAQGLADATRNLSKREAERTLAWLNQPADRWRRTLTVGTSPDQTLEVSMQLVPRLGFLVSGYRPAATVAAFSMPRIISMASTVGMLSLALLLAYLATVRSVTRPLRRMLVQLQRPAEDSLLEIQSSNEIGALAMAFNARHDRIRELLGAVRSKQRTTPLKPATSTPVAAGAQQVPATTPYDSILSALPDAIVLTDLQGKLMFMNSAAEALSGWTLDSALGLPFDEIFHIMDRKGKKRMTDLASRAIAIGKASERPLAVLFKTRSGHELPISISSAPLPADSQAAVKTGGAILVLRDSRNNDATSAGSASVPVHDPLTGMLNRLAFEAELSGLCEATRLGGAPPFHMLYIDVDNLSGLNTAFGSEGGDEFLRQIARLIQSDVGEKNPVYRLYGDKFAILLGSSDSAEAQVTAELLRADVQSWGFSWKNQRREVSVSICSLKIDRNSGRPVDILRRASELCEQAQAEGGARVVVGHAQRSQVENRDDRQWLNNIKHGLTEDGFHLSSQQIKPLQREVAGGDVFDSLLLLEDEEGFWTDAQSFMPVAVRHDLATQLDRWTVEQIFSRLADDQNVADQIDFCLISISVNSMQTASFLDFLMEKLQSSGVARAKICIDLDEHDVNSRLSSARDFCQALARAGCRLSLSKVSNRPSSLTLLKELPVHIVRFDANLTQNVHKDAVDRLATESLHRIVHTLGKQSLVTGIDSAEQLRIVQGIGVDYAQGLAIARPSPVVFHAQH